MVRALLNDAYNPVLATYSNAYLAPIMWEDALTQRVEGQTSNDIFVEKAITCHATLVLFKTRLGRGTREEVEALLAVPREQRKVLSVVRFALADDEEHAEDASAVTEFLHEIGEREKVYYRPTGPMGSPEASTELTKILNGYMLARSRAAKSRSVWMPPDRPDIEAALLWDVPALRRIATPGAVAFVDAFGPGSARPMAAEETASDVLLSAAAGVVADRSGQRQVALDFYDRVCGGFWEDILRHCLRAWSGAVEDTEDIRVAGELARQLSTTNSLRARIFAKLTTFAYDKFADDLVRSCLREALEAASTSPRLRLVLALESQNLHGEFVALPEGHLGDLPEDRLVDLDWIDYSALEGAENYFSELLADRARGPWSYTIRAGRRPLDQVSAAEIQATWAGAIWKRRPLRKMLGAQLLLNEPADGEQAAYALWCWLEAGGQQHAEVCNLVEPRLDVPTVDRLLTGLANRTGPTDGVDYTLVRVANAMWDTCSDGVADFLFDRLVPYEDQHPLSRDIRRLWATLAVRRPTTFARHLQILNADSRRQLADELDTSAIEALDTSACEKLLADFDESEPAAPPGSLRVRVLLRRRVGRTDLASTEELETAGPIDIIEAASSVSGTLDRQAIRRALEALLADLDHTRERARAGHFGFGGPSAPQAVAQAALLLGGDDLAVRELLKFAGDDTLPGQYRVETFTALAILSAEGQFSDGDFAIVRAMSPQQVNVLMPVTSDLLRAALLLVVAPTLRKDERPLLLALSRSRDERARLIAVNAVALADARQPDVELHPIVVGAMFDASEPVIRQGIAGITAALLGDAGVRLLALDRFDELLSTRRREVRVAVASTARRLSAEPELASNEKLAHLLDRARADKAWRVRHAAEADE